VFAKARTELTGQFCDLWPKHWICVLPRAAIQFHDAERTTNVRRDRRPEHEPAAARAKLFRSALLGALRNGHTP
jgi:hypothetical protein